MRGKIRVCSISIVKPVHHPMTSQSSGRTGGFPHTIGKRWTRMASNGGKTASAKWLNTLMLTALITSSVSSAFGKSQWQPHTGFWEHSTPPCHSLKMKCATNMTSGLTRICRPLHTLWIISWTTSLVNIPKKLKTDSYTSSPRDDTDWKKNMTHKQKLWNISTALNKTKRMKSSRMHCLD